MSLIGKRHSFDAAAFRMPQACFAPAPFWAWNADPTAEKIVEQLDDLKAHGADVVCLHPMPAAFRAGDFGKGMTIDYPGGEFFDWVTFTYERLRERGMHAWLYDEGGWPSGTACGKLPARDPLLVARVLHRNEDGTTEVRVLEGRVDRLNPRATEAFLGLTHERYRAVAEEYFGETVPWTFTDEPRFEGRLGTDDAPWYPELAEDFERASGRALEGDLLAAAFERDPMKLSVEQRRARVAFMRCVCRRFVKSYFGPIRDWCGDHGLQSGGHLGGEDEPLAAVRHGFGDISLCLDALDVPGTDTVWRQLFPGVRAHHFPKYASSSAHRCGRKFAFTESFAVYGQGLTLEQMKWATDFQFVRGANLMVFSNHPMSTEGPRMLATRTFLSPVNPVWRHFKLWSDYVRRLSYVCSCGAPAIDVAVMDITSSLWAGPAEEVERRHERLTASLAESQVDFDYLPGTGFADRAEATGGKLAVGPMRYGSVVTSQLSSVDGATWEILARFVNQGGRFLVERGTGPMMLTPETASNEGAAMWEGVSEDRTGTFSIGRGEVVIASVAELASDLPRVVSTERPASWLRAMKRRDGVCTLYLLVNEEMRDREETVVFRERGSPKELDLSTGEVRGLARERLDGDGVALRLAFARAGSKVIVFDDSRTDIAPSVAARTDASLVLDKGWEARRLSEHVIEKDDILVRAVEEAWRPVSLGDWRKHFGDWFSGEVAYRVRFDGRRLPDGDALLIDLGDVCYAAEVRLNGVRVGARAWAPFALRVGRQAIREKNVLEVRVANTLANVMLNPAVRADWAAREEPGYRNAYDDRAVALERDSAASGLMGPVRVIAHE